MKTANKQLVEILENYAYELEWKVGELDCSVMLANEALDNYTELEGADDPSWSSEESAKLVENVEKLERRFHALIDVQDAINNAISELRELEIGRAHV